MWQGHCILGQKCGRSGWPRQKKSFSATHVPLRREERDVRFFVILEKARALERRDRTQRLRSWARVLLLDSKVESVLLLASLLDQPRRQRHLFRCNILKIMESYPVFFFPLLLFSVFSPPSTGAQIGIERVFSNVVVRILLFGHCRERLYVLYVPRHLILKGLGLRWDGRVVLSSKVRPKT